ncbi:mobile mystery protein B [Sodalis sp. RH21]|uniref:mobile mystery protein B n=1 Tax=unclassified Sodalis (in: enterobacteria) TaxID=2636512 RepID=UPI0039B5CE1A
MNYSLSINERLPDGATALSPDDLDGLIPNYIAKRSELNEFEKENIQSALIWLDKSAPTYKRILTNDFCFILHKRMFNKTWKWAGKTKCREVNIGNTAPYLVTTRLKDTLDNTIYWIENSTFPVDEIFLRVHRNIVWIHPFS